MTESDHFEMIYGVYTPISEIEAELEKRRADKVLRKKVEDFFGEYFLEEFRNEPRAVLSRPIINANREFKYFLDVTHGLNLKPLGLEYHDKFVAKNWDKYHMTRLFFGHISKSGHQIFESIKIINFNENEGKNFKEIKTFSKESIIDFHHDILFKEYPEFKLNILDISEWFQKTRNLSNFYYMYFLSLFVCHGVLFDNYIFKDKGESDFFLTKIWPSFQEVERKFGVKPLIHPLLPLESENHRAWVSYEKSVKKIIEDKLKNLI